MIFYLFQALNFHHYILWKKIITFFKKMYITLYYCYTILYYIVRLEKAFGNTTFNAIQVIFKQD